MDVDKNSTDKKQTLVRHWPHTTVTALSRC